MSGNSLINPDFAPPTAFYFHIRFLDVEDMESSFQEVTGLNVNVGAAEFEEGGDNQFIHNTPTPPNYENLVLKRCLMYNSKFDQWCRNALEDFNFDPRDMQLSLIGANGEIQASWLIAGAFPIAWELSSLNNTDSHLAIETLTLKYRMFKKN